MNEPNINKINISTVFVSHIKNDTYDFYTVKIPSGATAINGDPIGGFSFTLNPELVNPVSVNRVDRSINLYEITLDSIHTYKVRKRQLKPDVEPKTNSEGKRVNPHSDYETVIGYLLGGDIIYGLKKAREDYLQQKATKTISK